MSIVPTSASVNPNLQLPPRHLPNVTDWTAAILRGDRVRLAQAITLIESTRVEHQTIAQALIAACLPHAGRSLRIGITGTPGVGKSTFIECFGKFLASRELAPQPPKGEFTFGTPPLGVGGLRRIAVLAVDPSSQVTRGSILGDKTRMQHLATNPNVFIRPSPSGTSLGGVARQTRETIILCEAAGFDTIIVETVGVGQSETAVHSMTDFFLLLLQPNAGDELQGIKRGIVEMADLIAVNKADGDNEKAAELAQRQYQNALHLFPVKSNSWIPQVLTCSALSQRGIADIWQLIQDFETQMKANGWFENNRSTQNRFWLQESIERALQQQFYAHPNVKNHFATIEAQVQNGELSPFEGAKRLLGLFV
jgi:LAO/AO transport system kinase